MNVFRRIVGYLASAVLFFAVAFGLGSIVLLVMDRWALDKAVTIASWFTGALMILLVFGAIASWGLNDQKGQRRR